MVKHQESIHYKQNYSRQMSSQPPWCLLISLLRSGTTKPSQKTGANVLYPTFRRKVTSATLLSIPSKVFCRVLLKRIDCALIVKLRQEQVGFQKDRGSIYQIFALRTSYSIAMSGMFPCILTSMTSRKHLIVFIARASGRS